MSWKSIVVSFVIAVPALARTPAGGLKEAVGQVGTKVVTTVAASLTDIVKSGETKELVVEILRGADLTVTDDKNRTLIHIAAQAGRVDMVETLKRHGLDGQEQDDDGLTASQLAEKAGHTQIVELLTAEEQETEEEEMLSLIDAVINGDRQTVEQALKAMYNVNEIDDLGRTALHHAVIRNNIELAELLIENDASLDIKDNQERTPADYAEFMMHNEIAELIENKREQEEQECADMDKERMERVTQALAMRQKNKTCRRH